MYASLDKSVKQNTEFFQQYSGRLRTMTAAGGALVREWADAVADTTGNIEIGMSYNCNLNPATGVWAGRDVADICWLEKWSDVGGKKEFWYANTNNAGVVPTWRLLSSNDSVSGLILGKEGDQLTYSHDKSKIRRGSFGTIIDLTGTTVNGSAVITGLSSTAGLSIGMTVTGTGIGAAPNGIISIDSTTQVTLMVVSTASASVTVTFANSTKALNGTTSNGSAIITALASTAGLSKGHLVTGTGIGAAPNYILSVDSATQITLTVNSSASATVAITFTSQLYSLLGGASGNEAMEYVMHGGPVDVNGNFGAWESTGTGILQVISENNLLSVYAIASLSTGAYPVAANFTRTYYLTTLGAGMFNAGLTISGAFTSTAGGFTLNKTVTAVGTTGNQTINKPIGRVNIAAAGTTITVTNSLVTANSIIFAVAATADATARVTNVVAGAGSFVINTVAVTAETAFNFLVVG